MGQQNTDKHSQRSGHFCTQAGTFDVFKTLLLDQNTRQPRKMQRSKCLFLMLRQHTHHPWNTNKATRVDRLLSCDNQPCSSASKGMALLDNKLTP